MQLNVEINSGTHKVSHTCILTANDYSQEIGGTVYRLCLKSMNEPGIHFAFLFHRFFPLKMLPS